jgi:hypothetical protein
MKRRLSNSIDLDFVFDRYKDSKKSNSIYTLFKKYPHLYDELKEKTSYLDDHFLRKEMGQRAYHYFNDIREIPSNSEKGRNYRYLSFELGYSDTLYEQFDLSKLNDEQLRTFFKSASAISNVKKHPYILEYLMNDTKYLDEFNPSIRTRIFYLNFSKTKQAIINKNGKLFQPKFAYVQCLDRFNIIEEFILMSDIDKCRLIRDNILMFEIRLNKEEQTRQTLNSFRNYTDHIGWDGKESKLAAAYRFVNNLQESPHCVVCNTKKVVFNDYLLKYPETCGTRCSNRYFEHIDRRLSNNSNNTYKTNIGKNELKILELLKVRFEILDEDIEYSKRIGPFVCDALVGEKLIVEINEKHHLFQKHIDKDIVKYDYLTDKGYKLLIIWDTVAQKKKRAKEKLLNLKKMYTESYPEIMHIDYSPIHNNKVEILTDDGFKKFKNVISNGVRECVEVFTTKRSVSITKDHIFFTYNDVQIPVSGLQVGDQLKTESGYEEVVKIEDGGMTEVYDIVASENFKYITNGFVSHQCLLLDEFSYLEPQSIVEDFVRSVIPTISRAKTSKILITSTPKGKNNIFHTFYSAALKEGTPEWNEFHPEEVQWTEIPGRDEEWKRKEIAKLGSYEAFAQEYECHFADDGTSAIDVELFDELKKNCSEPKHLLDDGHYKIWEDPDPSRLYVAGVDVSEGVGGDASVIQMLDITDLKDIRQVAEYHSNTIAPAEFSNKLHDILLNWGSPLVLIERNNQGGQVCDRLAMDFAYEKVVSWGAKQAHKNQQFGVLSHTNTKHAAILNQRYFINEIRNVTFRSIHTLNEFKTFIRYPNATWKAKGGEHDDRVMAFVWALMILHREITQMYFEIDEEDDYGKPAKITPYNYGIKMFENPTSIYTNEQVDKIENSNLSPMAFGAFGEADDEMAGLFAEGWMPLNGAMPYVDPSRSYSQDRYDAMERVMQW